MAMPPKKKKYASLDVLLRAVRSCALCRDLPLGPRPVLRVNPEARLLIVGQAPGTKVHNTGLPWNDRSGDVLRGWMDVDRETFYDESRIAIIPAGLCYPGKGKMGDLPPRKECSEIWLPHILPYLTNVRLTLLVGSYAQRVYLGERMKENLTETVRAWRAYMPEYLPTPHPSFHNLRWQQLNPWFQEEVVPALRAAVHRLL
ncbi:MAG: uracil-DNA glycosylase family protein [Candidatus Hydrogenedentes bacterium]|nr:uracil-DNA glycosylase family protein [Candidatus Hydrogenedentota bacterium]